MNMNFAQAQAARQELRQLVWSRIGFRKWLVGRAGVDELTNLAVMRWPAMYADSLDAQDELRSYLLSRMRDYKGNDRRYGSIWIILLSAVIAQVVEVLVKWWLSREDNRKIMQYLAGPYW